jgi:Uncharacterised nucleotidyltransferase
LTRRAPRQAWLSTGAVATLALDAALAEAVLALRAGGIEPLLIKGPAIAHLLYDVPAERVYGDIDLLVEPGQVPGARAVLAQLGYSDRVPGLRATEVVHAEGYRRGPAVVELHWQLNLMRVPDAYDLLSHDSVSLPIAGVNVQIPSPAGQALIVALHAVQHGPAHVGARTDLALAVDRLDLEVWSGAARIAEAAGVTAALRAGLEIVDGGERLADEVGLSAPAPAALRRRAAGAGRHGRVEAILEAPGWGERGRRLLSTVFPSRGWMYDSDPRARRGLGWLLLAYALRLGRVGSSAARRTSGGRSDGGSSSSRR